MDICHTFPCFVMVKSLAKRRVAFVLEKLLDTIFLCLCDKEHTLLCVKFLCVEFCCKQNSLLFWKGSVCKLKSIQNSSNLHDCSLNQSPKAFLVLAASQKVDFPTQIGFS